MIPIATPIPPLPAAIAALYDVFREYDRPAVILTDGNSITPAQPDSILSKSRQSLTVDDLRHYVVKAMTTAGTENDFRYFLPRILELAMTNPPEWISLEIVLGKLDYAKWQDWPTAQRSAIRSFMLAWWRQLLTRFPFDPSCEEMVSAIGCFDDLEPYLALLEELAEGSAIARLHLMDLMLQHLPDLLEHAGPGASFHHPAPFWSAHQDTARRFTRWLCSDSVAALITRACHEFQQQPDTEGPGPVPLSAAEYDVPVYLRQRERLRAWAQ